VSKKKAMKQAVRRSGAPNIHEGRALTLKVLKARMALSRNGCRDVPKEEADEERGGLLTDSLCRGSGPPSCSKRLGRSVSEPTSLPIRVLGYPDHVGPQRQIFLS
jgi:hypothetical protein